MITVVTANSFAYLRNSVETYFPESHLEGVNVLIPIWPGYDVHIDNVDYDVLETPETIDSLVYGRFQYLNHTWNDVLNYKTSGILVGSMVTENAFIRRCIQSYGPRVQYILPGTSTDNIIVSSTKRVSNGLLHHYTATPLLWDATRDVWYSCDLQFYTLSTEDDGTWISNAYGSKVARSGTLRLQNPRYRCAVQSRDGSWLYKEQNWWYDAAGHIASTNVPYDGLSTPHSLVGFIRREYVSADSTYRKLHGDPLKWSRLGAQWIVRGHVSLSPRMPNYSLIFDEKGRNPNWHELAGEAYQSLGMADINGVANLVELFNMGSEIVSFVNTLKSVPHKKVKAVASAWLAVHYGFKLSLLDAKELRDVLEKYALKRSSLSKCQAVESHVSDNNVRYDCRYQVFYDEWKFVRDQLGKVLSLSDAYISSENIWDMVPWSFVVDWFISIGDLLQSLDNYANLMQKHDVICCGRSIKGVYKPKPSEIGVPSAYGALEITYFRRAYSGTLLRPSLVPSVTVNPFNHLIEGAALYISIK